jgi:hypothetical protein
MKTKGGNIMITILIGSVFLLVLALVLMILLPIASVLAIPVMLDITVIIVLIKIFTRKKKEDKKA